ncbi:MAG: sigma-70 family RNA polymerase sigma factor [Firmicutes bacterium]|nr:sigma-70 family RNA polymerase sigma factor [Bacillota bacterium]MDD4336445.1 sigma-70 family RNA polymerase sigma factor [Bacillota bacterium]MDD4791588.1 sigma-70 family RNA polymerase sigma factor [Bacillota bacterium]
MGDPKWTSLSDLELARMAATSSQDAYSELVRRHSDKLLNLAWRMSGSEEEAWDAVQEAFLAGWRSIGGYRGDAQVYTWLRKILVNVILGKFRNRDRLQIVSLNEPREFDDSDVEPEIADDSLDPQEVIGRMETIESIRTAVAELPPIYRSVFVLREAEMLSYSEIAEALDISEGTVKSRLHMARRLLRERLTKEVAAARRA